MTRFSMDGIRYPVLINRISHVVMHENLKTTPRCSVAFDALIEGLNAYIGK